MTTLSKTVAGILIIGTILVGCISGGHKLVEDVNGAYAKTSVSITLENKRSGGSGVILRSTPNKSWILTNKHVCGLIQNGGVVNNDQGTFPVYSFQVYKQHDLCLISVMTDLHVNTYLAEKAPATYDLSIVVGHPALLPTMVTRGHFADHITIQVMVGTQDCDGTESDPQEAFMCAFFGQKPVIASLDAQPTTATIMAGSSGSGVFNSKGQVSGLVFAGSEGLSYGFLVPFEHVKNFIDHIKDYPIQFPDKQAKPKNLFLTAQKIEIFCRAAKDSCKGIVDSGVMYDSK